MTAGRRQFTVSGPQCPAEPLPGSKPHGPLIGRDHAAPGRTFHCPHSDHYGRPKTHPMGEAPASKSYFGMDEVAA